VLTKRVVPVWPNCKEKVFPWCIKKKGQLGGKEKVGSKWVARWKTHIGDGRQSFSQRILNRAKNNWCKKKPKHEMQEDNNAIQRSGFWEPQVEKKKTPGPALSFCPRRGKTGREKSPYPDWTKEGGKQLIVFPFLREGGGGSREGKGKRSLKRQDAIAGKADQVTI